MKHLRKSHCFPVYQNREKIYIPCTGILYFDGSKVRAAVITAQGDKYACGHSLDTAEEMVRESKLFLRIDSSCLVNILHIRSFEQKEGEIFCVLKAGISLPVSLKQNIDYARLFNLSSFPATGLFGRIPELE